MTIRNGSGIDGGGFASFSSGLTVYSTISLNPAVNGAGMYNGFGSSTTVANTTISGNTQDQCCASFGGGGILNLERLTVISSTIWGTQRNGAVASWAHGSP